MKVLVRRVLDNSKQEVRCLFRVQWSQIVCKVCFCSSLLALDLLQTPFECARELAVIPKKAWRVSTVLERNAKHSSGGRHVLVVCVCQEAGMSGEEEDVGEGRVL